ncbi:MAG: hypothetical protein HYX78_12495 [Armatimonadetes bacterium]|nr:hypothetical protein [Armatimonadota bacterium]
MSCEPAASYSLLDAHRSLLTMKCKKCGQSLHPDQKVCLDCGTQTDRWPGGPAREEKPPIEIPWTPVAIIGGGLLIVIVLVVIAWNLRVVPPDQVTMKWLDAVASRNVNRAKDYTTEHFESLIADRPMSAEKSDEYYQFVYNNDATYTVTEPIYDAAKNPTSASVAVTLKGENGQNLQDRYQLVRVDRAWKLDAYAP